MQRNELFNLPQYQEQDLATKQQLANEYFDKYYATNKLFTDTDETKQKEIRDSFVDAQIDFDMGDTIDKSLIGLGLKDDGSKPFEVVAPDKDYVDLTPKKLQDQLHQMPQTKEEALAQTQKFLKQQEDDKLYAKFAEQDKPLEDTTLDFAFAGAGGVRALQGVGAKTFAKTAPEVMQAEKMIAGGRAFAAGDIAGNVVASGAMKVAEDSMSDEFKKENPLLSGLLVMSAAIATGGVAGYKAEKQVMKKYNTLVEEVKQGKVKPQEAEAILKEDGFNADEYLASTKEPKLSDELDQVDTGFKELETEINADTQIKLDDTLEPKGYKEPIQVQEPEIVKEPITAKEEVPKTPQQTLQKLQSDIVQASRKADFEESADNVAGATKIREDVKLLEKQADTTRVAMGDELLKHPRAEELLKMRESILAKDSLSPQSLVTPKDIRHQNTGNGWETDVTPATYEKNYNYDFEITKQDVQNIREGKFDDKTLAKLEGDLDTLDNHPDYALAPKDELPTMSDADLEEANTLFANGGKHLAVGVVNATSEAYNTDGTLEDKQKAFIKGLFSGTVGSKVSVTALKKLSPKLYDKASKLFQDEVKNGKVGMFVGSKPTEMGALNIGKNGNTSLEDVNTILDKSSRPYIHKTLSDATWKEEFNLKKVTDTANITDVNGNSIDITHAQMKKMVGKARGHYLGLIKPTLQDPTLILKHGDADVYISRFYDENNKKFNLFAVSKDYNTGELTLTSVVQRRDSQIKNKILEGEVTYIKDHGSVDGTSSSRVTSPDQSTGSLDIIIPQKEQKLFNKGELKNSSILPDETKLQLVQRKMQDKFNRVKQLINHKSSMEKIDDVMNPYQKEELMHGKIEQKIEQLERETVSPILEKISRGKFTVDDVDEYLLARHAPERNAKMLELRLKPTTMTADEANAMVAKYKDSGIENAIKEAKQQNNNFYGNFTQKNLDEYILAKEQAKLHAKNEEITKVSSALSGMSNKDATKILQKYAGTKMEDIAKDVYAMNRDRLHYIMDEGLESKEFIKKLEDSYDNYVPLRRELDDKESFSSTGKGFDIKGKEVKKAKGSDRKVESPLMHSILAYEETIVRAEKNQVGKSFLDFTEKFPDETLYSVSNTTHMPQYDKNGAVVGVSPNYKTDDNVLHVKVDGKVKEITIHDEALASAFKNLNSQQMNSLLTTSHKAVRVIAGLSTSYNPEFVLSNFTRDIQTAMINMPDDVKGSRLTIAKDVLPAMKGIYSNVRGGKKDEWGILFDELRKEGGTTGWTDMHSVLDMKKSTQNIINKYNGKVAPVQKIKSVLNYIDDVNDAVENSSRLIAYKMAKESGMSNAKAASIAKNLTVNFNRKGEAGTLMNTLYMFYNASIQGSTRMVQQLTKSKTSQAIVASIAGGAIGLDMYNRSVNAEAYDMIPKYIKDTNYIFMNSDGTYKTLKLPYGYNVFKASGDLISQVYHGEVDAKKIPSRLLSMSVNAFSPIGVDTDSIVHTVAPTLAKPSVEIAENRNFFGGNIRPDDNPFTPAKPDSQTYFKSVNPVANSIAQTMNKYTGGTMVQSGMIDVSPESIEHVAEFLGGGLSKFVIRTGTVVDQLLDSDKKVDMNKVPFSRGFYHTPREKQEASLVYKMYQESGKNSFNEIERKRFAKWAKAAKDKKDITREVYNKLTKAFNENQRMQDFMKKYDIQNIDDYMNSKKIQKAARNGGLSRNQRNALKKLSEK